MLTSIFYSALMAIVVSIYILTIDIVGRLHTTNKYNSTCIVINKDKESLSMFPARTVLLLSIPFHVLQTVQYLLYRVSLLKCSCAQAPYSMKGLIIGLASFQGPLLILIIMQVSTSFFNFTIARVLIQNLSQHSNIHGKMFFQNGSSCSYLVILDGRNILTIIP